MGNILSTTQFENGLPILAELDLSKLFDAFFTLKAELPDLDLGGDPKKALEAILSKPKVLKLLMPLLETAGQAGKAHILRRISVVVNATDAELLQAERSEAKLQEMEDAAAQRTYMECAQDVLRFFSSFGLSASVSPASSEAQGSEATPAEPSLSPSLDVSPSVVS